MIELLFGLMAVVAAVGVILDGRDRKVPSGALMLHALACLVAFILALPWYLAVRPLKEGEVREGGRAWNVLRYFALTWTVMNAILLIVWIFAVNRHDPAIDRYIVRFLLWFTLTFIILLWFWPMVFAVLLGFFLKNSALVERGPTGLLAVEDREQAPLSIGEINLGWASGPGTGGIPGAGERDSGGLLRRPPPLTRDPKAPATQQPMLLRNLVVPPPYRSRKIVLDGLTRRLRISYATHDGPEATLAVVLRRVELRDDSFFIVADQDTGGHRIELAVARLTRIMDLGTGEEIDVARFGQSLADRLKTHGYSW